MAGLVVPGHVRCLPLYRCIYSFVVDNKSSILLISYLLLGNQKCSLGTYLLQVQKTPDDAQARAIVQAALSLFTRNNSGSFVLTLLNLGACNFVDSDVKTSAQLPPAFAAFLVPPGTAQVQAEIAKQSGLYISYEFLESFLFCQQEALDAVHLKPFQRKC